MSYAADKVGSLHDEISRLQDRVAQVSQYEAQASERIARATDSLSRASSSSNAKSYQREIQNQQRELARHQSERARLSKDIATKQKDLARYQKEMIREQQRDATETATLIKQLRDENRKQQERALQAAVVQSAQDETTAVFDCFISHASEDKDELVRPLAQALTALKNRVWYDEFTLKVGDRLRRSIDRGLAKSRFGIVVLSPYFFEKEWPQLELDGLVAKEGTGQKVILPLWHRVSKNDVIKYSPTLADRVALSTAMFTIDELAGKLHEVLDEGRNPPPTSS
jgi:hypothetical protein